MKNIFNAFFFFTVVVILSSCEPEEPLFQAPSKESIKKIMANLEPLERITTENISSLTNYSFDQNGRITYLGERLNQPIGSNLEILFGKEDMILGILDNQLFMVICEGEIITGPMNYGGKKVLEARIEFYENKYSIGYILFDDGQIGVAIIGGKFPQFFHYD